MVISVGDTIAVKCKGTFWLGSVTSKTPRKLTILWMEKNDNSEYSYEKASEGTALARQVVAKFRTWKEGSLPVGAELLINAACACRV